MAFRGLWARLAPALRPRNTPGLCSVAGVYARRARSFALTPCSNGPSPRGELTSPEVKVLVGCSQRVRRGPSTRDSAAAGAAGAVAQLTGAVEDRARATAIYIYGRRSSTSRSDEDASTISMTPGFVTKRFPPRPEEDPSLGDRRRPRRRRGLPHVRRLAHTRQIRWALMVSPAPIAASVWPLYSPASGEVAARLSRYHQRSSSQSIPGNTACSRRFSANPLSAFCGRSSPNVGAARQRLITCGRALGRRPPLSRPCAKSRCHRRCAPSRSACLEKRLGLESMFSAAIPKLPALARLGHLVHRRKPADRVAAIVSRKSFNRPRQAARRSAGSRSRFSGSAFGLIAPTARGKNDLHQAALGVARPTAARAGAGSIRRCGRVQREQSATFPTAAPAPRVEPPSIPRVGRVG